jgi:predicted site-specific integrase-resolvase
MYRIGTFAKMIGRSIKTLQRWDAEKKLVPIKSPGGGHRYYTDDHLRIVRGLPVDEDTKAHREIVVYCRVSSAGQKADLQRQIKAMEDFSIASGRAVSRYETDIGSGLNYTRKNFVQLMRDVERGKVREIVVAHKDRLVRFGYEWYDQFCKDHGCTLTVVNSTSLSPEQEMTQDLLSIIHCFSSRLYGLRKYKTEIRKCVEASEE